MDGGPGSLSMLPSIVKAVGDRLDVFFDSGVRCGADIAKALALGADMCLIGRPYGKNFRPERRTALRPWLTKATAYGLAMGGEEGVSHVLKSLLGDLQLTLHLAGIESVSPKHLNSSVLVREDQL